MFETIINLLYPNVCGFCNTINKEGLCKKCELKLKKYEINNVYGDVISVFKYEDIIRKKIIEYKFGGKSYLYKTFAKSILNNKKIYSIFEKYDIIIPVPVHKKRRAGRGYDQSELVAKEIAKVISITLESNVLIKAKNTDVQSLLTRKQRKENIKDAFEVRYKERIQGKKIVLLDDVYTTGATINECKKILKESGAIQVLVITIAKD
ncbi:MAG: ComF family protein [Oscillospiraceae bacterium]|nr:ComF family protein [Oscillospiraceae bacterium]